MKKAILVVLFVMIGIFTLTGCNKQNQFEVGAVSTIEPSSQKVSLSIKNNTLTNNGTTIILANNTDEDATYGSFYALEIKEDGNWHQINVSVLSNDIAYTLKAGETKEIEINWKNEYGSLAKGEYRIIKDISFAKADGTYDDFYVAGEFSINYD